ncbi:hypothetical protein [Streptomyces sp. NPDC058304]|uniref:hypothetical protein n=1 Tax=Streptomyces sp. NPDC058304 TaxID=3346437 RepID=UPI0036E9EA7E
MTPPPTPVLASSAVLPGRSHEAAGPVATAAALGPAPAAALPGHAATDGRRAPLEAPARAAGAGEGPDHRRTANQEHRTAEETHP